MLVQPGHLFKFSHASTQSALFVDIIIREAFLLRIWSETGRRLITDQQTHFQKRVDETTQARGRGCIGFFVRKYFICTKALEQMCFVCTFGNIVEPMSYDGQLWRRATVSPSR